MITVPDQLEAEALRLENFVKAVDSILEHSAIPAYTDLYKLLVEVRMKAKAQGNITRAMAQRHSRIIRQLTKLFPDGMPYPLYCAIYEELELT